MRKTFNTTGWTQEQKNMLQASLVSLLYTRGVSYISLKCLDGTCYIEQGVGEIEVEKITEQDLLDMYTIDKQKRDEEDAKAMNVKV